MQVSKEIPYSRMLLVALLHLGVGIAIVVISSFVNAELKLAQWPSHQISFYLGFPVLFELSRLFFAHVYDQRGHLRSSMVFGLSLSSIGIILIPSSILPIGNPLIIIAVSFFYFGSSILTTLVDANLTRASESDNRSRIAGVIQVLRLVGFAIGGIVGSLLYSRIEFSLLITLLAIVYSIVGLVSIISVLPTEVIAKAGESFGSSLGTLSKLISQGTPLYMTIFLLIYPIGLFMQDLILEPFAIDTFDFGRDSVGRVVAIWTTLTLVFVPLGVYLDKLTFRMLPILVGEFLSLLGLILIGTSSIVQLLPVFYTGLVLFGVGNGIASAPAIGMMLDVSAAHPKYLALLLGFFGIMTTIGRFLAANLGGLILLLTSNNYVVLFFVEAIFVVLGVIPLIPVDRALREETINPNVIDPIQASSMDLS